VTSLWPYRRRVWYGTSQRRVVSAILRKLVRAPDCEVRAHEASCFGLIAKPDFFAEKPMLYYAVVFFVVALVAALLGFTGIAAGAAGIAKILFFLFLIIAATTLAVGLARRT
jgi:uncharacterized membrane protein YtjA (UPF0391 family)